MDVLRLLSFTDILPNNLMTFFFCEFKKKTLLIFLFLFSFYGTPALSAIEITYSYDDLNRLKTVTRADGPSQQYNYDEAGNFVDQAVLNSPDTDGDLIANFVDTDDDNDNLPDTWELQYNLDPLDPTDASEDPDGDGQTNLQEFQGGTDPNQHNNSTQIPTLPPWALVLFMLILVYHIYRQSNQRQGV